MLGLQVRAVTAECVSRIALPALMQIAVYQRAVAASGTAVSSAFLVIVGREDANVLVLEVTPANAASAGMEWSRCVVVISILGYNTVALALDIRSNSHMQCRVVLSAAGCKWTVKYRLL